MKYVYLLLLLFILISCKKKDLEIVVPPKSVEQELPDGIDGLNVKGVAQSGILFSDLNQNGMQPYWIQITLPSDYPYGEMMTLSFKMKAGYSLGWGDGTQFDPKEITLDYEGGFFMINIISPENKILDQIYVQVNPTKPLEAPSLGKQHNLVIDGNQLLAMVPVKNWGTNYYLNDSLTTWVRGGKAMLKNIQSGETVEGQAVFDVIESEYVAVVIPETIDAGEYELTLVRNQRSVVAPDRIVIKYGDPIIKKIQFVNQTTIRSEGNVVLYHGFNMIPGHKYEMALHNDLMEVRKFALAPVSHIELQTKLPMEMPSGTYQVELFIDGMPVEYWNEPTGVVLLYVKTNPNEPAIGIISQRSQVFTTLEGSKWYMPVSNFNREEEIILLGDTRPHILVNEGQISKLILKSVDDNQTYELPLSNVTVPAFLTYFPQFILKDRVPSGRYEVRLSIQVKGEDKPRMSGPYYRIITIE